jgi:AcrR family transcriptional regulator
MTKDCILAAAKIVLDREGIPGFTIRKIAERAGMSPMAMYRHFANKDALLDALMEDGLAAHPARRSAARTNPSPPRPQIMPGGRPARIQTALRKCRNRCNH